jgi:hypothetical protein
VSREILSLLPDELRAVGFEEELAEEERRQKNEGKKAEIVSLLNLMHDLRDLDKQLLTVKSKK